MDMHHFDEETYILANRIVDYALDRLRQDPPPLDGTESPESLLPKFKGTITKEGLGAQKAFDFYENIVSMATISTDHPRYLSFVPNAPTNAASLFDLVVSASSVYGGTWLEGAGVVAAENQALRFISDMIGFNEKSGGVFVSGGTAANLSALIAARFKFRQDHPEHERSRLAIMCAPSAHSSIRQAMRAMDVDIVEVAGDEDGRLTGDHLIEAFKELNDEEKSLVFCVVASAGATNNGYVDELNTVGKFCNKNNLWFHVDGAYGGAAILCDKTKPLFKGVELADTFIVDPHKWLFSPFDCAALIYKDPTIARLAHSQHAEYLDVVTETSEWNPSDYAHHLTRRARGLPLWFSLVLHGTDAYRDSISHCMEVTYNAVNIINNSENCETVIDPQLSVILFRRKGWDKEQYYAWSQHMLDIEYAFVVPTTYKGETVLRFCIINPNTTADDIQLIIDSLEN